MLIIAVVCKKCCSPSFIDSVMPEWRHQAGGRDNCLRRSSGGVLEWDLGYCVWWLLDSFWCNSCLQTAGILNNWYKLVVKYKRWWQLRYIALLNFFTYDFFGAKLSIAIPLDYKTNFVMLLCRCTSTFSCPLWPGNWPNSPGWSYWQWSRNKAHRLFPQWSRCT